MSRAFLSEPSAPAALVHHKGTMIRFRTSQLGILPNDDVAVTVLTPDGLELQGRFRGNPANPYIGGRDVVRWIKRWVKWNRPEQVTLANVVNQSSAVQVLLKGSSTSGDKDLRELFRKTKRGLRNLKTRKQRIGVVKRWERDPRVRTAALAVWDHRCQVKGCKCTDGIPLRLRRFLLDVHHLDYVSARGDDSPLNLCLICAAHHQLIHRAKNVKMREWSTTQVLIHVGDFRLQILRDIKPLCARLAFVVR